MVSYNLLREQWISANSLSGVLNEYGIVDLLTHAHELRAIIDASPIHQFGMYRLLTAFIVDALHLSTTADVALALKVGKFGPEIETYAKTNSSRFDLFDATHPFMQVSKRSLNTSGFSDDDIGYNDEIPQSARRTKKSYAEEAFVLFATFPHGINRLLLDVDVPKTFSCGECAKALCSVPVFAMSGGKGKGKGECATVGKSPGINGAPPWYLLATGDTLLKTLLLNARGITLLCESGRPLGTPLWRAADQVQLDIIESAKKGKDRKGKGRKGAAILEGMTWPARVVHLFPSQDGDTIHKVFQNTGLKLDGAGTAKALNGWRDPNVTYNKKKPVTPFLGAWRDIGQFMAGIPEVKRAKVVISTPSVAWTLEGIRAFELYGVRTKQDKIFYWKVERLRVPKLMPDDFESVMVSANIVDAGIYHALVDDHDTSEGLIENVRNSFWRTVQDAIASGTVMSLDAMVEGCYDAMQAVLPTYRVPTSSQKLKNYVEKVMKNDEG